MEDWRIISGPREFRGVGGRDMENGWAWSILRGADKRTVLVVVAGGRAGSRELPEDSREALRTSGRSAVAAILDRQTPPRFITVTNAGLREETQ